MRVHGWLVCGLSAVLVVIVKAVRFKMLRDRSPIAETCGVAMVSAGVEARAWRYGSGGVADAGWSSEGMCGGGEVVNWGLGWGFDLRRAILGAGRRNRRRTGSR
jgi:hypothetical protein